MAPQKARRPATDKVNEPRTISAGELDRESNKSLPEAQAPRFSRLWLLDPTLGHAGDEGGVIRFRLDPTEAWREAPNYQLIKQYALGGLTRQFGRHYATYVDVGTRSWLVLPNKNVRVTGGAAILVCRTGPDSWKTKVFSSKEKGEIFTKKFQTGIAQIWRHANTLSPEQRLAFIVRLMPKVVS